MKYLSDILALAAIVVSVVCACIAYKQSNKQFTVSLHQNEIGNQLALIDKRIELYLFLGSVKEKLDALYAKEFGTTGVRQKKINAPSYVLYTTFSLDLFHDVNVDYKKMDDHDAASLQAVLSRLDRYCFYAEVFWKNDETVSFLQDYKDFNRSVIIAAACDSEKAVAYSYARNAEAFADKSDALEEITGSIKSLKEKLDQLPLEELKKYMPKDTN